MNRAQAFAADVSFAELAERRRGPVLRFLRRHPVATDAMVVGIYLLLAGGLLILAAEPVGWLPVAGVLATAVALWFRRRAPFAVLGLVAILTTALMVVDPFHGILSVGLWIALYTAATKYTWWRMAAMAVLLTGVQLLMVALWVIPHLNSTAHEPHLDVQIGSVSDALLLTTLLTLADKLIAVGIGAAVRGNRLHQAELANWGLRVQRLAQVHERNRIAREMHDVVAHSLSVMVALADGAAVVVERNPARAREVLTELSSTGRGALRDARRVIGVLREEHPEGAPAMLEPQPDGEALHQMLDGFRVAGLPLVYEETGLELPDDAGLRLTVHRIIQESLTNVLRYGREVTRVRVSRDISQRRSGGLTVRIRVHDDGTQVGASTAPRARGSVGAGQGLKGMVERAAIYDGTLQAGPDPAGGWSVNVELRVKDN